MISYNAQSAREKALRGVMELADECVDLCAQLRQVADENASMQALLERKEREPKGCEFCVPNGDGDTCELTHREDGLGTHDVMYIDPKAKRIACVRDGFVLASKEVGFCPMCGRPL